MVFWGPNGAGKNHDDAHVDRLSSARWWLGQYAGPFRSRSIAGSPPALGVILPKTISLPDDIEVTDFLHYVGELRGLSDVDDRISGASNAC